MKESVGLALRGFCMGIADIIPGVSGGTMALVLGIYTRLLLSIRHIDLGLLKCVGNKAFYARLFSRLKTPLAEPSEDPIFARADALAFLAVLLLGIATAIITAARFIPELMAAYPQTMRGFFFGLIMASVIAPYRQMKNPGTAQTLIPFAIAAIATFFIVGGQASESHFAQGSVRVEVAEAPLEDVTIPLSARLVGDGQDALGKHGQALRPKASAIWSQGSKTLELSVIATRAGVDGNSLQATGFLTPIPGLSSPTIQPMKALTGGSSPPLYILFLAGAIAISAMILPGLSGAFLLLLMGQYDYVLFHLRGALGGSGESITVLVVFLAGITVGILAFSRVLTRLLDRAHNATMAALMGLMVGSLRKLWPFQDEAGALEVPSTLDADTMFTLAAWVFGLILIGTFLTLDKRKQGRVSDSP